MTPRTEEEDGMFIGEIRTRTLTEQPTAVRRATLTVAVIAEWFPCSAGPCALPGRRRRPV
jgi:hypothetical protein